MLDPSEVSDIVQHVARSLWASAFADACERARDDGDRNAPHPGAGGEWFDVVPFDRMPQRFSGAAARAIGSVPLPVLSAGCEAWERLSGRDRERFAHVVAMRLLGHGVGLFDDLPPTQSAEDRAAERPVRELSEALPRIGESCDVVAFYDPDSGLVE